MSKENSISFVETPKSIVNLMIYLISKKDERRRSVLDAGCGKGVFIDGLKSSCFNIYITGIEIKSDLIEFCKEKFSGVDFLNLDYLIWNTSFKYDIIIGNPPYAHFNSLPENIQEEVSKLVNAKESDIYYAFIIKSIELLRSDNAELIYIVPYGFFYNTYAETVRKAITDHGYISVIIDLDENRIFKGEHPETIIFKFITLSNKEEIARKNTIVLRAKSKNMNPEEIYEYAIDSLNNKKENKFFTYEIKPVFTDPKKVWSSHPEIVIQNYKYLKDIAFVGVGLVSGFDEAFRLTNIEKEFNEQEKLTLFNFIKGENCKGFYTEGYSQYILLDQLVNEEETLKQDYPHIYQKIIPFKEKMVNRYLPKNKKWFHWQALRNKETIETLLTKEKIFVPTLDRSKVNRFSICKESYYPAGDVLVIVPDKVDPYFLLGYLNSTFFRTYYLSQGGRRGHRISFTQRLLANSKIPNFSGQIMNEIRTISKQIVEERDLSKRVMIDEIINSQRL